MREISDAVVDAFFCFMWAVRRETSKPSFIDALDSSSLLLTELAFLRFIVSCSFADKR